MIQWNQTLCKACKNTACKTNARHFSKKRSVLCFI